MSEKKRKPMKAIAKFIVEKRLLFYILFLIAFITAIIFIPKVKINYSLLSYLPPESETKIALDIMDNEFEELSTANIMISNITFERARSLADSIAAVDGVDAVLFDDSDAHYKSAAALITVNMTSPQSSEITKSAYDKINTILDGYDVSSTALASGLDKTLAQEMTVIMIIAVAVILLVLIFTSKSFMEIPVFFIVFIVAAALNMGSNALMGEISFITNTIAVLLQLALAIDYSIILCHRFMEERQTKDNKEAAIAAVSKAIPEIFSSSLTTVSGLVALMLMQLRIGYDMGMVLAKGVILSCLTVFLLMPGLLMLFSKPIEKTKHRSFVPNISGFARGVVKSRFVLSSIFICIVIAASILQSFNLYAFDYETNSEYQTRIEVESIFGKSNALGVLVPKGDYEKEKIIIDTFSKHEKITSATGMSNIKIGDTYLVDKMIPKQFSDFTGIDLEPIKTLYRAYGLTNGDFSAIGNVDNYGIALVDIVNFLYDVKSSGIINLDEETANQVDEYYQMLNKVQTMLEGETYSRIMFNLNCEYGGKETFTVIKELREQLKTIDEQGYLMGYSVNSYDLSLSFNNDLTIINLLTALFILIILLFTFKSIGLPLVLILTIQGSIWINFALPFVMGTPIFFMSYLIISAIQMGATIDYAIVITNRYQAEKKKNPDKKSAMITALNGAFPTVFTSGSILTVAGFLVGYMSTDPIISSIGRFLGQGTLISLIAVMVILPQILLITDKFLSKTSFSSFTLPKKKLTATNTDINGKIKGEINGYIEGTLYGKMSGDFVGEIDASGDDLPPLDTELQTTYSSSEEEAQDETN